MLTIDSIMVVVPHTKLVTLFLQTLLIVMNAPQTLEVLLFARKWNFISKGKDQLQSERTFQYSSTPEITNYILYLKTGFSKEVP